MRNYCYDDKCYELAVHFFGAEDPRLADIAQDIQDTVETHPSEPHSTNTSKAEGA